MSENGGALLAKWFEDNTARFDIRVHEFPKYDLLQPYAQSVSSLTVDGAARTGSAISPSRGMAVFVSMVEALERHIFALAGNMPNTNGVALHTDHDRALFRAASELVERDRFLCHYLTKQPVADVTDVFFTKNIRARTVRESFRSRGVRFCVGEMRRTAGLRSVLCVAFIEGENPFLVKEGILIGLGCEASIEEACEKAFLEAVKGFTPVYFNHEEFTGLALPDFIERNAWDVHDHRNAGFTASAIYAMEALFPKDAELRNQAVRFVSSAEDLLPLITVESLPLPVQISSCPISAAYANSSLLQNAFWGTTTSESIDLARIERFLGRDASFDDLQHHPHPLS